jgi:hypothetical protein
MKVNQDKFISIRYYPLLYSYKKLLHLQQIIHLKYGTEATAT